MHCLLRQETYSVNNWHYIECIPCASFLNVQLQCSQWQEIISLHDIKALTYFSQQMSSKWNHIQPDTMWGNNEIRLCFCATRVAGEKGTFYSTLNLKILFRQWTFGVPIKRYCVTPNFSLFSCRPLWTWCGPPGGHTAHVEKPWSRRLFCRLPQQGSFIAYKACNSLTILWQLLCIEIW